MYRGPETSTPLNLADMQDSFFSEVLNGNSTCNNCGNELLEDLLEGPPSANVKAQLKYTTEFPEICQQCHAQMWQTDFGHWPGGDLLDAPFTPLARSPTPSVDQESPFSQRLNSMPTKVKALLADLAEHAPIEKR
jgi:hypothetical protein